MKSFLSLQLVALCLTSGATCQSLVERSNEDVQLLGSYVPHPYVYFGPSLMGGGYAPLAYRAEVGVEMESSYLILRALGAYDDGHKVDPSNGPNPNGHDRKLESEAYYRFRRGLFLGAGWRWSRLSTTAFTKSGTEPEIGGGYDFVGHECEDCRRDFSMRIKVRWVMAGNDWENGSHGPSTVITLPAPSEKRHWFYQQTISVYRFHTTVTEPSYAALTQSQRDQRSFASYIDFGVIYRF